jgi:hypothetical protein
VFLNKEIIIPALFSKARPEYGLTLTKESLWFLCTVSLFEEESFIKIRRENKERNSIIVKI